VIHLSRSSRRRHDTRTHAPSHVSTRPCTHARARAHVHLGGEKPSPFSLCSSIERSSPAFRRGEPRRRPLWCRSTQWCERQVLVELTRPFSCTHARSLADTSHPSRAAETPFHRARALLAAVPCPLHTGAGGGHPCLRGQALPCTRARPCTGTTGHRRQPQPRRRRHGVCRRTGRDLNLAAPVFLFQAAPFLSLMNRLDPVNLAVGLVV
jgi:hypothetical protein